LVVELLIACALLKKLKIQMFGQVIILLIINGLHS